MKRLFLIATALFAFILQPLHGACNKDAAGYYYYFVVVDRDLNSSLVAYVADHTSFELWKIKKEFEIGEEYTIRDIDKPRIRLGEMEILCSEDWKERYSYTYTYFDSANRPRTVHGVGIETHKISVVYEGTTLEVEEFSPVKCFPTEASALQAWSNLITKARKYDFAEQMGFDDFSPVVFKKWKNSKYESFGNNCHTFTRWLCQQSGTTFPSISDWKPGNKTPQTVNYGLPYGGTSLNTIPYK